MTPSPRWRRASSRPRSRRSSPVDPAHRPPLRPSPAQRRAGPRAARGSPRARSRSGSYCGRQPELLAEPAGVLVDREAGADGGDLEQHPARLAEVDGAEVLPVDDPGRAARRRRPRAVPSRRGRRRARSTRRGAPSRRPARRARAAPGRASRRLGAPRRDVANRPSPSRHEPEPLDQQPLGGVRGAAVGAHAHDARQRVLGGDARDVDAAARRPVGGPGDDQLDPQPLGVRGDQRPLLPRRPAGRRRRGGRPRSRATRATATRHTTRWIIPGPGRPTGLPRISKKVRMLPGDPDLVAEVQVVHVRRVEVDRLLHQPKAHEAHVEVQCAPGVGRDGGHVVDPVEAHRVRPLRRAAVRPAW